MFIILLISKVTGTSYIFTSNVQCVRLAALRRTLIGWSKTDTQFYFWDNFGNSAPILTILSLSQADIYGA